MKKKKQNIFTVFFDTNTKSPARTYSHTVYISRSLETRSTYGSQLGTDPPSINRQVKRKFDLGFKSESHPRQTFPLLLDTALCCFFFHGTYSEIPRVLCYHTASSSSIFSADFVSPHEVPNVRMYKTS
jgi:hypothetical protein